jgi:hypothetical protein
MLVVGQSRKKELDEANSHLLIGEKLTAHHLQSFEEEKLTCESM